MLFISLPQAIDFEKHETSNYKLEPWYLTICRFQKLSINRKASLLYISHCKSETTTSHINIRFVWTLDVEMLVEYIVDPL